MPSRIGKKIIEIPDQVKVQVKDNQVQVTGPKGELVLEKLANIDIDLEEHSVHCPISGEDNKKNRANQGLFRSLLANAVIGVSQGWEKKLEVIGVGYKVSQQGSDLQFNLGFSHPIHVSPLEGLTFTVKSNVVLVSGIDKQQVGQQAASIRQLKKPEPYKGKGIRYSGEQVRRKVGKAAKSLGK